MEREAVVVAVAVARRTNRATVSGASSARRRMENTLPLFIFTRAGSVDSVRAGRQRRTRKQLRIDFLGLAGPLQKDRCGKLRDAVCRSHEGAGRAIPPDLECQVPAAAREAPLAYRARFPFFQRSRDPRASSNPRCKLRRRFGSLQLDRRRSKQLIIATSQRGHEVRLRFVSLQLTQRCRASLRARCHLIEGQSLQRRDLVRQSPRRARHTSAPATYSAAVAAEQRNERAARRTLRQRDEGVRLPVPLTCRRRARFHGNRSVTFTSSLH